MNAPEKYNNYVDHVNHNKDLTRQLVAQIKKDFGSLLDEKETLFEHSLNSYQAVYDWIFPVLQTLYRNDRQRFTSLIYAIDAAYMKNRFGPRTEPEIEQWTHAILLRECLKIFIRNNYKV